MSTLEQIAVSWFLNAVWELPPWFVCCWLFLRLVPNLLAGTRHMLWFAALSLGFLTPFGTVLGLWGDSETVSGGLGLTVAARLQQSFFGVVAAASLSRFRMGSAAGSSDRSAAHYFTEPAGPSPRGTRALYARSGGFLATIAKRESSEPADPCTCSPATRGSRPSGS